MSRSISGAIDLTYFKSDAMGLFGKLDVKYKLKDFFNNFESINYNSGEYPLFSWALKIWLPSQLDGATEMERVIVSWVYCRLDERYGYSI